MGDHKLKQNFTECLKQVRKYRFLKIIHFENELKREIELCESGGGSSKRKDSKEEVEKQKELIINLHRFWAPVLQWHGKIVVFWPFS